MLALPAFRGADEFDHAYKADAVAHGQVRGTVDAQDGRGQLLQVERELVTAAGSVCSSYRYTGPDNCRAVGGPTTDRVEIASAAASYNPSYYLVVGTIATPFDGMAALFAMRVSTALLTSILLACAAAVTARWARTGWPLLALAVTCTPVLVQSGAVAAPNAVGYAAGCLVWAAGLGLVRSPEMPGWWAPLTMGSVTLLVTHTTGVVWLVCIALVLLSLQSPITWQSLARTHLRSLWLVAVATGLTAVACVGWILLSDTNQLSPRAVDAPPIEVRTLALMQFLWAMQTIAAFPLRNEMAPVWVYAMWTVVLGLVAWLGFRAADTRTRRSGALLVLAWLVVPLTLTVLSYASEGYAWQGRYALPLAVGVPALCGLALDRRGAAVPRMITGVSVSLVCIAHLSSIIDVARDETRAGFPGTWAATVPGGLVVIVLLAVAGMALTIRGMRRPAVDGPLRTPSGQLHTRKLVP